MWWDDIVSYILISIWSMLRLVIHHADNGCNFQIWKLLAVMVSLKIAWEVDITNCHLSFMLHIIMSACVYLIILYCVSSWTLVIIIFLFFLLTAGGRTWKRNCGVQRENRILPCKNAGTCEYFPCFLPLHLIKTLCFLIFALFLVSFLDINSSFHLRLSYVPYRCS